MCELVPPGSAGVSGRLSSELQIGGFALPSPAARGAGAVLGGEGAPRHPSSSPQGGMQEGSLGNPFSSHHGSADKERQ